jgi:hypothetical protein
MSRMEDSGVMNPDTASGADFSSSTTCIDFANRVNLMAAQSQTSTFAYFISRLNRPPPTKLCELQS